MSLQEAEFLTNCGRYWCAKVWLRKSAKVATTLYTSTRVIDVKPPTDEEVKKADTARTDIISVVNGYFSSMNLPHTIKLGRGWQIYDPVIRVDNKCHRYLDVAAWAGSMQDGGVAQAISFHNWYSDTETTLLSLPVHLQALAVITHMAEVGRGYSSSLESELKPWIESICNASTPLEAKKLWGEVKTRFTPSLTYPEDSRLDYMD
ncbi:hypothetical protein [Pseudomonas kribbensis]|uniref:Uncharacterized protein n=1 Tax=Pseudomonas kribbensis TaxID=1628086 RepID=A0A4Y8VK01_9PSED|nr:hypothetical protein [Pseudomonas kribbensis]TFH80746.1 hypothetical protein E4J90_10780 [Pseudomonas kribbensis]